MKHKMLKNQSLLLIGSIEYASVNIKQLNHIEVSKFTTVSLFVPFSSIKSTFFIYCIQVVLKYLSSINYNVCY